MKRSASEPGLRETNYEKQSRQPKLGSAHLHLQYKILNNIVFINEEVFRLKVIEAPLCVFCKGDVESLDHLLFFCEVTKMF